MTNSKLVPLSQISESLALTQKQFQKHLPSDSAYVRGDVDSMRRRRGLSLGIVGTRMPSPYGYRIVEELMALLRGSNVNIVSGGAFGIDSHAHRMALRNDLPTRSWLVGPIDDPNPRSQRALFEEIAQSKGSGLLVPHFLESENTYRLKLGAKAWLARNAWIVADSDLVLCVEASIKSGTWQTARDSSDLGRDFFVVPGSVFEPRSEGCNRMISNDYAKIMPNIREFAESLVVLSLQNSYNREREIGF